eukprot:Nitzschia sp. Nitz4//scaffold87_size112219//68166//69669//NITZ4_004079-RA/size112219-augustus-gene-0.52-mRNA-1//1//CDS//3329559384//4775//frame0
MVLQNAVTVELARKAGLSTERFPANEQEQERAEKYVTEAIEGMSVEEQEKTLFEIHGISPPKEETEEAIQSSLVQLEKELHFIDSKDAYEQALFLNASYVTSREFRLLFLRCEDFDAAKAAQTMVYHFDLKRELFGDSEILAREVYQSDLDEGDMGLLRMGISQLLPSRDAGGRFVTVTSCDEQYEGDNPMKTLRAFWYCMMTRLRDVEVQTHGIVDIVWHFKPVPFSLDYYKYFNRLEVAIPMRVFVEHYCRPKDRDRMTEVGFKLFASVDRRIRYKVHLGTPEEILFSLQTYGLPVDDIPGRPDGTWHVEAHQAWIEAMRKQEEEGAKVGSTIIIPRLQDVLFGKNARARDHPGNLRAQNVVDDFFDEYEKADKVYKSVLADKMISKIKESGGRFLKQRDDGGGMWEQASDKVARQKVAHWCRHKRHKSRKGNSTADTSDGIKREMFEEQTDLQDAEVTPQPSGKLAKV